MVRVFVPAPDASVVPDVAVPEAQAYDVAYGKALRDVLALDDVPPPIEHEARDALAGLPKSPERGEAAGAGDA